MSNNASGRMITEEGTVVNIADTLGGVEVDAKRDINFYSPKSGRILDEEGNIVNIADLIGGVETGRKEDIDLYYPASGNLIKEDGSVVNVAKALVERLSGGGGGGTSEGVNLSYTLNKDGTYTSKSASKDSEFPSGEWFAKFIYVSDKTYTIDELIGHTIRTKEINVPTGVINEVRDIEITRDMITDIGNGTFAIIDSVSELPILTIITEEMVGVDIGGGFVLPSNAGTYLVYADKSPDKQGYVFGSVSVKKAPGKPYIDTSGITKFGSFCQYNRFNDILSVFDTSNAREMNKMFYGCTTLEVIPPLDTSNCKEFEQTFYNCPLITTIPLIDTSNGEVFRAMFEACINLITIPPLDTSKGKKFDKMFYGCRNLETIPQIDTSNLTDCSDMFYNCAKLTTIPPLNTSGNEVFTNMFYGCTNLKTIPPLDTSKGRSFIQMFYNCNALTSVSLTTAQKDLATSSFQNCTALENLTIGEGWAVSIYLHYSNNLTVESLHGMIENLADLTGKTAKKFQIGATNIAKLDEAHIAMLNAKNWEYS